MSSNDKQDSSASDGNTPVSNVAANISQSSADDNLVCRWNSCNERFNAAESLYVRHFAM